MFAGLMTAIMLCKSPESMLCISAHFLEMEKNWPQAIINYSLAIDIAPKNTFAYYRRSWTKFQLKEYDGAITDITHALELDPTSAQYLTARGIVWQYKGERQKAIDDYSRSIQLEPDYIEALFNRGTAYQRILDRDDGWNIDPESYQLICNPPPMMSLASWKSDLNRAIADYTETIRLKPRHIGAITNRGHAWRDLGEYDKAIADYTTAIESDPQKSVALIHLGLVRLGKKQFDQATRDLDESIRIDPKCYTAFYVRALAARGKGNLDQAINDLSVFISAVPNYHAAYLIRAGIRCENRQFEKAIDDFSEYLRLNPQDTRILLVRGRAWLAIQAFHKTEADWEELLRKDPKCHDARASLAALWATCPDVNHHRPAKAVEFAQAANAATEGRNWHHVIILAVSHAATENYEEAIKWAEKAVQLAPNDKAQETSLHCLELFKAQTPAKDKDLPMVRAEKSKSSPPL